MRLSELVHKSKKILNGNLSDEAKVILVQSYYNQVFDLVGNDISKFLEQNIFCLEEVRNQKLPKQFVRFRNEVNAPQFLIGLN